jgi:hypothetical protein
MSGLTPEEEHILQTLQAKKAQSPGSKIVHVIQVLDKSSSMGTGIELTIAAFNENLNILSSQTGVAKTTATLITFSDANKVKAEYQESTPDRATRLSRSNYEPRGMTALYDAIGYALEISKDFEGAHSNAQFLLQIFTDGDENVSVRYTAARLKSMIEELNATGRWTVTVMGPKGSLDLFTKNLGVYVGNTVQFDASSVKSRGFAKSALNASTSNYFMAAAAGATSLDCAYSSVVSGGDVDNLANGNSI